jgi:deazaflavin-dependent oxidoreductase (nitroreductase family)
MSTEPEAVSEPGPILRATIWFTSTRVGQLFYVHVVPPVDRKLMRWSKGRWSLSPHGRPNDVGGLALLETIGSKTGTTRYTPLGAARDGDSIVILASNAARSYHPNWYYNLKKTPEVTITMAECAPRRYRAEEIPEGPERERLWKVACTMNPGFDQYPPRTGGRLIPVIHCTPID